MMQHPGLMRDIVDWDVLTWQDAILFWEKHVPDSLSGCQALELGAANGGLSLYLSLKGADVICSDLNSPATRAAPLHQRYALDHVSYQAIDARSLPFADASLDLVCFKSVLGGIRKGSDQDPKPDIMAEVFRVLKPGGYLLMAENLCGSKLLGFLRSHFVVWSSGWEYLPAEQFLELLDDFSSVEYQTAGVIALVGRNECQRRLLSFLDKYGAVIVPPDWHYLFMAVAQK